MAIDNSLYNSLENTYFKIKDYLETAQLGREHSAMIVKHEALGELLESFDIEALEEQTKDIHNLHNQLDLIKETSTKIVEDLGRTSDSVVLADNVVKGLDELFLKIDSIVL